MNNKEKMQKLEQQIDSFENKKIILKETKNTSTAFNIATELVAAIVVGAIIGLFLDKMFDSKPILLIICMILAMIAAFKSIWNSSLN